MIFNNKMELDLMSSSVCYEFHSVKRAFMKETVITRNKVDVSKTLTPFIAEFTLSQMEMMHTLWKKKKKRQGDKEEIQIASPKKMTNQSNNKLPVSTVPRVLLQTPTSRKYFSKPLFVWLFLFGKFLKVPKTANSLS